ncbi:MAG: hypothetical protein V1845_02245 [bacterium]
MWETIKKVLQKQGGACIIIEDGKPTYVVSSFSEYQKLLESEEQEPQSLAGNNSEQGLLERINQEIENWKASQAEEHAAETLAEEAESDVKIEDLPL